MVNDDRTLAIDLGAATTFAALVEGERTRLVKEPATGGWGWPSTALREGATILIGTPADQRSRSRPDAYVSRLRQAGDDELLTAYLAALRHEAVAAAGGPVERVLLCTEPDAQTWRDRLLAAAEDAGFTEAELLDEPLAVAADLPRTEVLLCDLGAARFGCTLVRFDEAGRPTVADHAVVGAGGDVIDALLAAHLRAQGRDFFEPLLAEHPRVALEFAEFVRSIKHQLSEVQRVEDFFTPVSPPSRVTAAELALLLEPVVERIVRTCRLVLAGAPAPDIVFVGGGSRLGMLADAVGRALGRAPRVLPEPEQAVVRGAARFAAEAPARSLVNLAPLPGGQPLTWDIPGGAARLDRWLINPGEPVEAQTPLAQVRLPDGHIRTLIAGRAGLAARQHVAVGATAGAGDPLLDLVSPVAPNGLRGTPEEWQSFEGGRAFAFDADGRRLCTVSYQGIIRIFEIGTGGLVQCVEESGRVPATRPDVVARPDGSWVAACDVGNTVWLWSLPAGTRRGPLVQSQPVARMALSPDAVHLATADPATRTVHLWHVESGREVRRLKAADGPFSSLVFSPDGQFLATALQPVVTVWHTVTGSVARVLPQAGRALAATFSPDGMMLALDNGVTVRFADLRTTAFAGQLTPPTPSADVAISRDSLLVATANLNATVSLWNAATGTELWRTPAPEAARVRFSPDGRLLAANRSDRTVLWTLR